jgi:hypothetical protein
MAHWEQMYPSIDFRSFQGYPNYFDTKWLNNSPTFLGLPAPHIVNFLEYLSEIKLGGEDALIKLFLLTLPSYLQNRFKSCCKDRGISSFIHLISRFIDLTKPDCQTYEDVLQNLMVTLDHKGFTTEIVEDLRRAYHDQYQESSDIRDEVYEDHYQPLEEEQDLSHNPIECNKDITRDVNYEDEAPVTAPQSDEALQDPVPPAQDEENEVSHFPFQFFDDTLFYDSESEEEMEPLDKLDPLCLKTEDVEADLPLDEAIQILEALAQEGLSEVNYSPFQVFSGSLPYDTESTEVLDVLTPPCYDTDTDIADFDEFIHVGRRRWDAFSYDMDPIYDIKSHLQVLPLQLSQQALDQWQQGDEIFTGSPQTPKVDRVQYLPDDFRSYLEAFDEYSSEHLDLPYEDDYQPPLCSDFDRSKNIVCLKKDSHDFSLQPPVITLPCFSIKGVVGKYIFYVEFPLRQTLDSKGWLGTASLSQLSQFFNFPLIVCQSSARSLSIPSLTSEHEDVLGSQFAGPLSQFSEPCIFHDPFLKWIEYFPQRWTWQDFIPPTRLHELDFEIPDDMIYILTHDIFVLDLSLFWFMMKHKGRYRGTLLDWLHWLFDYTNIQPTGKYR